MGLLSSDGILGGILTIFYNLGKMAGGIADLIGLM